MSEKIIATVPVQIMKVATKVAAALNEVPDDERDEPYVAQVRLGWEGETTDFALIPDEFGGYDLAVLRESAKAEQQPRPAPVAEQESA